MNINSVVTIVPDDSLVYVNGEAKSFSFNSSADIHAIQWNRTSGWIEYKDSQKPSKQLTEEDFATVIAPYVHLWEEQRTVASEVNNQKSNEYYIRKCRKYMLRATDFYLLPDYKDKLTEDQMNQLLEYRQALRDITKHEDFPWGGDPDKVCWPVVPSFINN